MRTPIFPLAVMRFTIGTVFYCSLFAAAASSQSIGSEPSPMEAFAGQEGVRTTWSSEVARWEQNGTRLVLVLVVLEDNAQPVRTLRGVKVELSSEKAKDQVYLDEQATERTRSALEEISVAVALNGMPGAGGCTGAKEFWPGYNWPWNKYHELNVDFCGDSKDSALVLHGRGKPGSFHFPGKSPTVLAEIFATAMEKLKQHCPEIQFEPRIQAGPKHISSCPQRSSLRPSVNDAFRADSRMDKLAPLEVATSRTPGAARPALRRVVVAFP